MLGSPFTSSIALTRRGPRPCFNTSYRPRAKGTSQFTAKIDSSSDWCPMTESRGPPATPSRVLPGVDGDSKMQPKGKGLDRGVATVTLK